MAFLSGIGPSPVRQGDTGSTVSCSALAVHVIDDWAWLRHILFPKRPVQQGRSRVCPGNPEDFQRIEIRPGLTVGFTLRPDLCATGSLRPIQDLRQRTGRRAFRCLEPEARIACRSCGIGGSRNRPLRFEASDCCDRIGEPSLGRTATRYEIGCDARCDVR